VTIHAFALGVLLGLGTLFVLAANGVHLGIYFGACAHYGLAGKLLSFVAAHGVIEISCLVIAGAAGLILGDALVSPGDLRRRDALVVRGKDAVRLVLGIAPVLVAAALVESTISPDPAIPTAAKALLGLGLGVLLFLWLFGAGRKRQSGLSGRTTSPARLPALPRSIM
jgi:uncharacterized membrane protein SpoIIM required for sporulation